MGAEAHRLQRVDRRLDGLAAAGQREDGRRLPREVVALARDLRGHQVGDQRVVVALLRAVADLVAQVVRQRRLEAVVGRPLDRREDRPGERPVGGMVQQALDRRLVRGPVRRHAVLVQAPRPRLRGGRQGLRGARDRAGARGLAVVHGRVVSGRGVDGPALLSPILPGASGQPHDGVPGHDAHRDPVVGARVQDGDQVVGRLLHDCYAAGSALLRRRLKAAQRLLHGRADVDGQHHLDGVRRALHQGLGPHGLDLLDPAQERRREQEPAQIRLRAHVHRPAVPVGAHLDHERRLGPRVSFVGQVGEVRQDVGARHRLQRGDEVVVGDAGVLRQSLPHLQRGRDGRRVRRALERVALIEQPDVLGDKRPSADRHERDDYRHESRRRRSPFIQEINCSHRSSL